MARKRLVEIKDPKGSYRSFGLCTHGRNWGFMGSNCEAHATHECLANPEVLACEYHAFSAPYSNGDVWVPFTGQGTGAATTRVVAGRSAAQQELDFALMHYRASVIHEWLSHLWNTSFNHGYKLTYLFGSPRGNQAGDPDAGASADKVLRALESAGWIKRADHPSPSPEQRFFGVGGSSGSDPKRPRYAVEYGWEPVRSCIEAQEWIQRMNDEGDEHE